MPELDTNSTGNVSADLEQYKLDISKDADISIEQRYKASEDIRFIDVDGGMWEEFLEDEFSNRTKLEFDLVSNFINRFIGEWNQNRVGVEYEPDDSKASDKDAELLAGIYRGDFRQNSGKLSVDNMVDGVVKGGCGAFKLATFFEDDSDPENDLQRIEWRPIHNAHNTVIWDSSAKRIDKRDAGHCHELISYTKSSFEKTYPGKEPVSAYEPAINYQSNYRPSSDVIYVAARYEVVKKKESVFIYNNLATDEVEVYSKEDHKLIEDELKADQFREFVRERKIIKRSIYKSVFSGAEFLKEPKRIAGEYIPIIPAYGYWSYVDNAECYRGLVRKLKDPARLFNMQVSQLAENSASSGQEVPILDPDQVRGVEHLWANRNQKPYMLARALRDDSGNIIANGPLGYLKPGALDQSTTQLLQIVPAFVKDATGGAPQDTIDPDVSGKAVQALQKREDLNTQVLFDNIANAIEHSGDVYQSIASEIYTTNRIIRTIGKDGKESDVELLRIVVDEETGKPVESNNLSGKRFKAYADVGQQYETQRVQTVENLKGMLDSVADTSIGQQYSDILFSLIIDNISGVGLDPLKEFNRNKMIMNGTVKPETDEEKAMLQQAQGQQDPTQKLITEEGNRAAAEARQLDASALDKVASANKKDAETAQIIQEAQLKPLESLLKIRSQTRGQAASGF